ncbi:MAG: YggS family pyridoxal phosphate-dependent enzyme, partial [Thalassospira sp.]|nr:YggS family pyridoxal phosphate-dependent enzyme [Thalassospira sp.]
MSHHDQSSGKTDVADNLAEIQSNINAACEAADRD